MNFKTRYVHTNLVARDWKALAEFYKMVFGCRLKPPQRNLEGKWLDDATSLHAAHLRGIHLHLPGFGKDGPTLEIFQYAKMPKSSPHRINQPGFGHIAFAVDNVQAALDKVIRNGGGKIGRIVSTEIKSAGQVEFVYACDPEGNIIELQKWT